LIHNPYILICSYIFAPVPCRLIHEHDDPVCFKIFGTFLEEDFHCLGIRIGKNEGKRFTVMGTYSTEYVGIFPYDMGRYEGSYSFWSPTVSRVCYSSKAGFVLEQEFHRSCVLPREAFRGGCHQLRKFFLNSSCFSVSAFGCRGRGMTFRHPCR